MQPGDHLRGGPPRPPHLPQDGQEEREPHPEDNKGTLLISRPQWDGGEGVPKKQMK